MLENRKSSSRRAGLREKIHGNYLVIGAFMLIIILMACALAIDIARKFHLEQIAQDVADAAALVGAQQLPNVALARLHCTTYIQQAAGVWYITPDSDIQMNFAP